MRHRVYFNHLETVDNVGAPMVLPSTAKAGVEDSTAAAAALTASRVTARTSPAELASTPLRCAHSRLQVASLPSRVVKYSRVTCAAIQYADSRDKNIRR
jgi:hypothetical protein